MQCTDAVGYTQCYTHASHNQMAHAESILCCCGIQVEQQAWQQGASHMCLVSKELASALTLLAHPR